MSPARIIVVGNEKGGAGKSTIATHLVVALLHEGARVEVIDLDVRQRTTSDFFANRLKWNSAKNADLPMPIERDGGDDEPGLAKALTGARDADVDFVVIDTPGADTALARTAHGMADLIVTPMNDSFVDFAVLGQVDPVTLEVTRPSLYALTVWDARKRRAAGQGGQLEWVVVRNRLASVEARNRRRVDERLMALARRVGFRAIAGLRDRVIYRELYPFGVTVSDLSRKIRPVPMAVSHVSARQELRMLLRQLDLVEPDPEPMPAGQ
ncbi:MAG: division plane positioning ATPase MipZ [Caulobacteraceae bacterium]